MVNEVFVCVKINIWIKKLKYVLYIFTYPTYLPTDYANRYSEIHNHKE